MSDSQLAVLPPSELVRQSTDIAGLCREIVLKSALTIQGRKYVRVEGWQSIATAHGCLASSKDVERIDGGFRAIGEVRRMSDGVILATAEGFVGEDEPTWFGGEAYGKTLPKRADYAIRAMAQTRAISRACRSAFAHVVVLMDAGLSTTPAEEVPHGGFTDDDRKERQNLANRDKPVVASHVHFGKNKGKAVADLNKKQLTFYKLNFETQREEGKKQSDADRALYAAVMEILEPVRQEPADDELPMFNGPNHKQLATDLEFNGITSERFMEVARQQKWVPESAHSFGAMKEETAAEFVKTFEMLLPAFEEKKAAA